MISVVVLTFNEAINIEQCLGSVSWADDVLVVDSGSTDETCEIAARLGARIMHRQFDDFASQRNFAIENGNLKCEWVLHLDADELVSPSLRTEIENVALGNAMEHGYRVPSRLMLMGRWLRYSGMYPAYQVRFGRRDKLRFQMVGHGQRETLNPDELGTLCGYLIHYNFSKGISAWVAKHARYARDEAAVALASAVEYNPLDLLRVQGTTERRRKLKAISQSLPLRPLARFLYVYVFRLGFLDGRAGLRYAILMAFYQWLIDLNIVERQQQANVG